MGLTNGEAVESLRETIVDLRREIEFHEVALVSKRRRLAELVPVYEDLKTLPGTNLLTGNARPSESPDFEKCGHPHDRIVPGPRIPLRYGSAATEVCGACGGYRQTRIPNDRWEPGPPDTTEDEEM